MVLDFISWMDNDGAIKCSSKEERHEVFEFLQTVGYEMGFHEDEYDEKPWMYVYICDGYIHMGRNHKGNVKTFAEAIDLYYTNDEELPDADSLPDVTELFRL